MFYGRCARGKNMKINQSMLVNLYNYVLLNSRITETGIQFSTDNVDYALEEIMLYLPNHSFDIIKNSLLTFSNTKEKVTYQRIEELLSSKHNKPALSQKYVRFVFFLPVSISINAKNSLYLLNKKIDFVLSTELLNKIPNNVLSLETIKKSIKQTDNAFIPPTFIRVNIDEVNLESALVEFWNIYIIIRSLLELKKSWGTQYIIHNTMDERGKIGIPDWVLIKTNNTYDIHRFKLSLQKIKQNITFTPEDFDSLKILSKVIKNRKDERTIDFLICRSFLLYNDALEQNDFNYCFLAFWQILETISLAERNGGDTKYVINRIAPLTEKILGEKIPLTQTLTLFAKKRCELVHSGIGNITNGNINKIKFITEVALAWLINNKSLYKTVNTLFQYYSLQSTDITTMNSIKVAIKIINKKT